MLWGKTQRIIPSKALPAGASFYSIDYVGWIAILYTQKPSTLNVLPRLPFPEFSSSSLHQLLSRGRPQILCDMCYAFSDSSTLCVSLGRFILTPPPFTLRPSAKPREIWNLFTFISMSIYSYSTDTCHDHSLIYKNSSSLFKDYYNNWYLLI